MLETDLYALLSTYQPLLTAISGNHVWLGMVPKGQDSDIDVVIQVPGSKYFKGYDVTNQLTRKLVQIDTYAAQYAGSGGSNGALDVSNIIRDLLKDMSGALLTTTVQGVILEDDMDMPYEPGEGGEVRRRMLRFVVWYADGATGQPYVPGAVPVVGANAGFIEGVPIAPTAPMDGQALVYSAAAGEWEPGSVASGGINFASDEVPGGTINGSNPTFTVAHAPVSNSLQLFKNGVLLVAGTGYTLSSLTITFQSGYIPQSGDSIVAFYRF